MELLYLLIVDYQNKYKYKFQLLFLFFFKGYKIAQEDLNWYKIFHEN